MGKYDGAVEKVQGKLGENSGIDPITISLIITAILEAIKAIQKCRNPDAVVKAAKKQTKGNRLMITVVVRRHLGRKKFKEIGAELVDAIIEAGSEATVEEIEKLLAE